MVAAFIVRMNAISEVIMRNAISRFAFNREETLVRAQNDKPY